MKAKLQEYFIIKLNCDAKDIVNCYVTRIQVLDLEHLDSLSVFTLWNQAFVYQSPNLSITSFLYQLDSE